MASSLLFSSSLEVILVIVFGASIVPIVQCFVTTTTTTTTTNVHAFVPQTNKLLGVTVNNKFATSSRAFTGTTPSSLFQSSTLSQQDVESSMGTPTELPDSIDDSAQMAATACINLATTVYNNLNGRCRVDFDTSRGYETFSTLKTSTEFMQLFTTALSRGMISGLMEYEQALQTRMIDAKVELQTLMSSTTNEEEAATTNENDESTNKQVKDAKNDEEEATINKNKRMEELQQIIVNGGMTGSKDDKWTGDVVRIYFPDEGNAALAKRDWKGLVPPCVEYSSLGGVQVADTSRDKVVLYFCPRAAESEYLEQTLQNYEENGQIKLSVLVNPLLVDMGVTGFGMAGRMLRERLLDGLVNAYYLRTLQWGALTRCWPRDYSVWQEDPDVIPDGYRLIKQLERLPSNPEVEDIYDIANGDKQAPKDGPGFLNALGDFVQGMTRL